MKYVLVLWQFRGEEGLEPAMGKKLVHSVFHGTHTHYDLDSCLQFVSILLGFQHLIWFSVSPRLARVWQTVNVLWVAF